MKEGEEYFARIFWMQCCGRRKPAGMARVQKLRSGQGQCGELPGSLIVGSIAQTDDPAGNFPGGKVTAGEVGTDAAESRQGIALDGGGSNDRGRNASGEAKARSGVDDMRVARPSDFHVALKIPGGRDCTIGYLDDLLDICSEGPDADGPASAARRGSSQSHVARDRDHCGGNSPGLENLQHFICGIALGDSAKVKEEVLILHDDGGLLEVDLELGPARSLTRPFEKNGIGKLLVPS